MARYQVLTGKHGVFVDGEHRILTPGDKFDADDAAVRYLLDTGRVKRTSDVPSRSPAADSGDSDESTGLESLELPPAVVDAFESRGLTLNEIAAMSDDDLLEIDGVGPATVKKLRAAQA